MEKDGEITVHSLANAVSKHIVALGDLVGKKALRVVRRSLRHCDACRVRSVFFDLQKRHYVVTVRFPKKTAGNVGMDVAQWLRRNYGPAAADTWMEGDITIAKGAELHLDLVSF